jgi:hypothetical protein
MDGQTTGAEQIGAMAATATAGPARRWAAVGASTETDSRTAGRIAAARALAGGEGARLLVVFASDGHDAAELLAGIHEQAEDVPLVGCSTAGEISTEGPTDAGVAVLAIGGEGFTAATAAARGASEGLREAGAHAAACLAAGGDAPHRVLLLLTDGLAGNPQEVVRGAYSVVGAAVPLVGGCAGDDLRMRRTRQFHGADVLENSVVAAGLCSDAPIGIGVRHGWAKVGNPMLVTRSSSCRVLSLDDQPALDVYLDRLGAPQEVRHDHEAFTRFAMTHPLGLSRRSGEEVRFIAGASFDDRSLTCIAEVPQGGLTWIMEGDSTSVLDATDAACRDALAQLEGRPPLVVIAFDCIARRGVLGDEGIRHEVRRIAEHAGGAPVVGFYTYGEIARTHGISGFHNQTLVVLALS